MRRALKLVLATLGLMAGAAALLVWDSIARADRALDANEARLATEIAALRARYPRKAEGFRFEMGHAGHDADKQPVTEALSRRIHYPFERLTADQIVESLATIESTLHEGGYEIVMYRRHVESKALRELCRAVREEKEPRRIAEALDRILALHPTVPDIVDGEHLLDRREVLNVIRRRSDPTRILRRRPGWKELFSWKILVAKALVQVDDFAREIHATDPQPFWSEKWHELPDDPPDTLVRSRLRSWAEVPREEETRLRADGTFTRVVVALCRYKAEKGRVAEKLEDLVPEFLPQIPEPVIHRKRFQYADGTLWGYGTDLTWP